MMSHTVRMLVASWLLLIGFLTTTYGESPGTPASADRVTLGEEAGADEVSSPFLLAGRSGMVGRRWGRQATVCPRPKGVAKSGRADAPVPVSEQAPQQPRPTVEQLVAACGDAKPHFVPRTEAHLQQAKADLLGAAARLDARLEAAGASGEGWKAFLDWQTFQEQLARQPGPDLTALDAVHAKFDSGHHGLNLIWFADVRQALRRYLVTARAVGNPKIEAQYEALLDALPAHLKAHHENPSADEALWIGMAVAGLQDAGQAPELVRDIRHHFSSPNLFVDVSADLIDAGLGRPVDEVQPVRDVILGSNIIGTGHATGQVSVELIPATEYGEINMVLRGTIKSKTTGYKGPARVHTDGLTQVTARKPIRLAPEQVWALPAEAHAVTDSTITNVRTKRGCQLVEKLAWKRARKQHPEAERIATGRAERRISRRLDRQAGELVDQVNDGLAQKFRRPLMERKLFPQLLRFNTTGDALHVTALHGGLSGLGTPGRPPQLEEEHDLAVCLHESMVNNLTAAAFAGLILEEERLLGQIEKLLGELPEGLQPDEEEEPWGITFARRRPISVMFADGQFAVTIRGRKYARGESRYPGMNVTAVYKIEKTEPGFKAVRQGDLQIFPPGFAPGRDRRLSGREQVLRTLLQKRFGKILDQELVIEDLVLPGRWEKVGKLALARWEASDGWMVLAWNRIPPAEKPEAATSVAAATR